MQFTITPEYLREQGLSPSFPRRFWAKVNKDGPVPAHMPHLGKCWMWTAAKHDYGYGMIGKKGHSSRAAYAHVASWILRFGPVQKGFCVCHHCDNPPCVNPKHLFTATKGDNNRDRHTKGRSPRGMHHGRRKLTENEVLEIRRQWKPLYGYQTILGNEFGVSASAIRAIVTRETWSHL